jgi:hypothetical protein
MIGVSESAPIPMHAPTLSLQSKSDVSDFDY